MEKFDPNKLPGTPQIWTDWDLAKFAMIAFIAGVIVGVLF
jgi:hypothetical protein